MGLFFCSQTFSSCCCSRCWNLRLAIMQPLPQSDWAYLGQGRPPCPSASQATPDVWGSWTCPCWEQWRRLPQAVFTNVLRSMRRLCVAVRDARDGHNPYWKHVFSFDTGESYFDGTLTFLAFINTTTYRWEFCHISTNVQMFCGLNAKKIIAFYLILKNWSQKIGSVKFLFLLCI